MRTLPFTLRQLQVFETLCTQLSFRECAEKLGISQASVSSQIGLLEKQLGAELFTRQPGKRPVLTLKGMAFRSDLKSFDIAGQKLAAHRMQNIAEDKADRYRVLIGQAMFDNYVRPNLAQFQTANPNIECEFAVQYPADVMSQEIEKGTVDFAMFHYRADRVNTSRARPLALVGGGIYAAPKLLANGAQLTPAEISKLPFILSAAGSEQERSQVAGMAEHGIYPENIICHSSYFDVVATMVENGMGAACLADPLLNAQQRKNLVMVHPLTNWHLMWFRKDDTLKPSAKKVENFLLRCILQNPEYPKIKVYKQAL